MFSLRFHIIFSLGQIWKSPYLTTNNQRRLIVISQFDHSISYLSRAQFFCVAKPNTFPTSFSRLFIIYLHDCRLSTTIYTFFILLKYLLKKPLSMKEDFQLAISLRLFIASQFSSPFAVNFFSGSFFLPRKHDTQGKSKMKGKVCKDYCTTIA